MATLQDIYNEIDRIDNAKKEIAEAIEEKGVEVPSGMRINNYPDLVRSIPTGIDDLFWCKYAETTSDDIFNAIRGNKLPIVLHNNRYYIYHGEREEKIYFVTILSEKSYFIFVDEEEDVWGEGDIELYQLPQGGVPETDLAQGVKYKLNYKEIFVAQYDVTTLAELQAALAADKLIIASWTNNIYVPITGKMVNTLFAFSLIDADGLLETISCDSEGWHNNTFNIQAKLDKKVDTVHGKGLSTNDYTTGEKNKLAELPTNEGLTLVLNGKYEKPSSGIPASDLSPQIMELLVVAASAYQKPNTGIPEADLAEAVQTKLNYKEIFVAQYGMTPHPELQAAYDGGKLIILSWAGDIYFPYAYEGTGFPGKNNFVFYRYNMSVGILEITRCDYDENIPLKWSNSTQRLDKVFFATYGTTTVSEIDTALAQGKIVVCHYQNHTYIRTAEVSDYINFTALSISGNYYYLRVNRSTGMWANGSGVLQSTSLRIDDVDSFLTYHNSPSRYPSAKSVFALMGKWGKVSQTITWTGSANDGYTYTLSDIEEGLILNAHIEMFKRAGAVFNETTGYFELNEITDIAYDEMLDIYVNSIGALPSTNSRNIQFLKYPYRTTVTLTLIQGYGVTYNNMFRESGIYIANITGMNSGTCYDAFRNCRKLKRILGNIILASNGTVSDNAFLNCYSLEDVQIKSLKSDAAFAESSKLSLDSIVYMVNNAANTSAITITLHASAYARCAADTTEYEYGGSTYTGILALATAKNITIASA